MTRAVCGRPNGIAQTSALLPESSDSPDKGRNERKETEEDDDAEHHVAR